MKRKFRAALRGLVADTMVAADDEAVDAELAWVVAALAGVRP